MRKHVGVDRTPGAIINTHPKGAAVDKQQTIEFVTGLMQDTRLPPGVVSDCVDAAAIPDEQGRMPDDPSWQPTFDQWWAAAEAATMAASLAGDQLTHVTSEGTTMIINPRNWEKTAAMWRRRSQIWADARRDGFTLLQVDTHPPYRPTTDLYRDSTGGWEETWH